MKRLVSAALFALLVAGGALYAETYPQAFTIGRVQSYAIVAPSSAFTAAPRVQTLPVPQRGGQWFVCPADGTVMRVPDGRETGTYKCPVDGTTMRKRADAEAGVTCQSTETYRLLEQQPR